MEEVSTTRPWYRFLALLLPEDAPNVMERPPSAVHRVFNGRLPCRFALWEPG